MSSTTARDINYDHAGVTMVGRMVVPGDGVGKLPGVIVIHEAFGLGDHAIAAAERLAEAGYAAFALDLWGDRQQCSLPGVMDNIAQLVSDGTAWMGRIEAARAVFASQPEVDADRMAAIGYCFGGASALEFARTGHTIKAVVSLHGGLDPVGKDWSANQARVLVCTGFDDPMVPASALTAFEVAMTAAGVNWEINLYGGTKHSFTNQDAASAGMPDAIAYNEQADRRSWDSLTRFLSEAL